MSQFKEDLPTRLREAELEYRDAQQRADDLRRKRDGLRAELSDRLQRAEEGRRIADSRAGGSGAS